MSHSPNQQATEIFQRLATVLRGKRWYVFGAQAAILWGAPRMSADVDITVELKDEDPRTLVREMEKSGFRLRIRDIDDFVARTRVLPFIHEASGMPVDVVLLGPGIEELFLSRLRTVKIEDQEIPVISPEDLIVTKVLAGRAKDLEDIRGALRVRRAKLNLGMVRETLALLEEALGQSDLLPLFEAEHARLYSS